MQGSTFNCGNCGASLSRRFRHARMIACTQCGSTSVLKDDAFELAGSGGVMQDAPSLVKLGEPLRAGGLRLTPVGHARFSYGRGWWDEFWCLEGSKDTGCWLSVDEGDYAVEWPLDREKWPRARNLKLGQTITIAGRKFTVAEAESAECTAVRGEFPEDLSIGETHLYFDLGNAKGEIATFETWDGGRGWTVGYWIDPWEVQVA